MDPKTQAEVHAQMEEATRVSVLILLRRICSRCMDTNPSPTQVHFTHPSVNIFSHITNLLDKDKGRVRHGWCSPAKAHILAASVIALRPETTVEIGVWGGRSFIPMALAHKEIGRGVAIGIDPWNPEASAEGQVHELDKDYWRKIDHQLVYEDFIRAVNEIGIQNCCRIERKRSDEVEPPKRIDILHIDGNHSDQAIKDVQRFAPNVRKGGLCFMDDIDWTGGGVRRAVARLQEMGFVQLYKVDEGACFQRI